MRNTLFLTAALALFSSACIASDATDGFVFEQGLDLRLNGVTWLRTVTTPFNEAAPEYTYKVYTHLYDFEGIRPITKGPGGRYGHHRGLFIGWNHTHVGDQTIDSWHMRAARSGPRKELHSTQELAEWISFDTSSDSASHMARIHWAVAGEAPYLEEERAITASAPGDGLRQVDFVSTLKTLAGPIALRGDPQHAGMQVRMSNEVTEHEETTEYILPEGATGSADDVVNGAWWVCGSMMIGGHRYWILHMTAPDLVGGQPQYSTRRYGRFGAFFEPDLTPETPLRLAFRVIWSETPLEREQCAALYQTYAREMGIAP